MNFFKKHNKLGLRVSSLLVGMLSSSFAFAATLDSFLAPFCKVQQMFSGNSPIVGFACIIGLCFIGGYFIMGEDKGIGATIIKYLIGGAVLVAAAPIVTAIFGISMGC